MQAVRGAATYVVGVETSGNEITLLLPVGLVE